MEKIIIASHSYSAYNNIIKPLMPFLKSHNYELVFIHINRISGKSKVVNNSNIQHFDLSVTNPKAVLKFIDECNPKALLCLEFTSLFIILLIQISKQKNIKTIYFEHGIFIEGHGDKFLLKNYKESIKRYLTLIYLYIRYCFLLRMSIKNELKIILKTFFKRNYSNLFDFGLFYAKKGYNAINSKLSIPYSKTYFAGYPLTEKENEIQLIKKNHSIDSNVVLFIHQPLIHDKLTSINYEEEIKMFYQINDICNERGLILQIKLHPRSDINFYLTIDKNRSLNFTNNNFSDILVNTRIIIGQFSTALFNGLILNLPIILYPYKDLKPLYYKDFIKFSLVVKNISELKSAIDIQLNDNFKRDLYGSTCAELIGLHNSFENQAKVIATIVN